MYQLNCCCVFGLKQVVGFIIRGLVPEISRIINYLRERSRFRRTGEALVAQASSATSAQLC